MNKEIKILEAARQKGQITYIGKRIKLAADLLKATCKTRQNRLAFSRESRKKVGMKYFKSIQAIPQGSMLLKKCNTCKGILYPWALLEQSSYEKISVIQSKDEWVTLAKGQKDEHLMYLTISKTKTKLMINAEYTNDLCSDKVK